MCAIPFAVGSDTSFEAALSIARHLNRIENAVYRTILSNGDKGANCWEVEQKTGISRACSSARLNGLVKKGLIYDTGARRPTDTGRNAVVYKAIVKDMIDNFGQYIFA